MVIWFDKGMSLYDLDWLQFHSAIEVISDIKPRERKLCSRFE